MSLITAANTFISKRDPNITGSSISIGIYIMIIIIILMSMYLRLARLDVSRHDPCFLVIESQDCFGILTLNADHE